MIPNLKIYLCLATVISLLTVSGLSRWETYSIKKEFAEYKENINDQVQKAKIEKARIDAEQRAKHDKEVADLDADRDRLNRILNGLRKPKIVQGNSGVPVAASCSGGVSGQAGSAETTQVRLTTYKGTCDIEFYSDAMMDNLQCARLIEFVNPTVKP
jgi:hypothetical protein